MSPIPTSPGLLDASEDATWPRRPLAPVALAALFGTGVLICVSASRSELLEPTSLRPLPEWLTGPLAGIGPELDLAALIVVFGVMLFSYGVAVYTAERLSPRVVLAAILGFNAVALFAPPLFSSDVFSYTAYARIGTVFGANPYLQGPSAFPLDALHPLIGAQWAATPSVYGPLFTALSYLFAPLGIAATVLAYKAVAAASSLALTYLVWRAAKLRGVEPMRAAVLVGLNPVIVLFGVGGGHNDMLMLALMVAGLYLFLKGRELPSGAFLVGAMAIKLTAGVLFPFALAARGREGLPRLRRGMLIGALLAAIAVAILAFAVFGTGPIAILHTLQGIQSEGGPHSFAGFLAAGVGLEGLIRPVNTILGLLFLCVLAWLIRQVWIGRLDWIAGAGWATVALLLTTGFLVPWYVAWLIPLAALCRDRRLLAAAILLTGVGLTTL
ncbi:MAG: polyprenol phosphomannose-dependent alpha 1,6 mannosyltransferase MptB [Actinobacteria bacterium]|nr:polyprenol phosphomannose-dependent alpha 1,6 mannosyltransferase MptB [Actinomycetota bacterium]